jgi:hypothetical protein
LAVLVFCELLCLGWARIRPPQNVIDAVTDLHERDSRRLELFHAASLVEINWNVPAAIFTVEDGTLPQPAEASDEATTEVVPISNAQAGDASTSRSACANAGAAMRGAEVAR